MTHADVEDVVKHRLLDAHLAEIARVAEAAGAGGCALNGDGDRAAIDDDGRVSLGLTLGLVESLDLLGSCPLHGETESHHVVLVVRLHRDLVAEFLLESLKLGVGFHLGGEVRSVALGDATLSCEALVKRSKHHHVDGAVRVVSVLCLELDATGQGKCSDNGESRCRRAASNECAHEQPLFLFISRHRRERRRRPSWRRPAPHPNGLLTQTIPRKSCRRPPSRMAGRQTRHPKR